MTTQLIAVVRSNDFLTEPRAIRMSTFLAEKGYDLILLGLNREGRLPRSERLCFGRVFRLTFRRGRKLPTGKATLFPFIAVWQFWIFVNLLKIKPTSVIASDLDALLPCVIYSQICGRTLIYEPYDLYGGTLQKPIPKAVADSVVEIERKLVSRTSAMILPDMSRLSQYDKKHLPDKIIEIVNTPDPNEAISNAGKTSQKSALRIFYSGVLAKARGLLMLIDVVGKEENMSALFAGHGEDEDEIVRAIKSTDNCRFLGRIPHAEVMRVTMDSDVVFAFYDPAVPNHLYASPNKLYEAMCCSKPLIVNDGTKLSEVVRSHKCGLVVPFNGRSDLTHALRILRDNMELRDELGRNGRVAYERNYSWTIMRQRLEGLLNELWNVR